MSAIPTNGFIACPRPYLGQSVIFWDAMAKRIDGHQQPRLAFITGFCEEPDLVHLTVFNHPDEDCRLQGMGPVRAVQRVPFRDPTPNRTIGFHTYCTPAGMQSAGVPVPLPAIDPPATLRIPVVGTIRREETPENQTASSAEDVTLPTDTERKLVPLGDNGQPIEDSEQAAGIRTAKRKPPEQTKRLRKSK